MSVTDDLLRNNERYAESFDKGDLPLPPGKHVAVVAASCSGTAVSIVCPF